MKDQHSTTGAEFDLANDDEVAGGERPHLITVDELRAAGALDVPASWRKSLGVERGLLFDLFDDNDTPAEEQASSDDQDAE